MAKKKTSGGKSSKKSYIHHTKVKLNMHLKTSAGERRGTNGKWKV